jgi:hypothetical protein
MSFLDLFRSKHSGTNSPELDAIYKKYADQADALQGTEEEIAEQKKMLDDLLTEELAALNPTGPKVEPEQKVTVEFTVPRFRYKGVEYVSKDVEAAAAAGNEDAQALINKLIDIKSGNVKIVNE